MMPPVMRSLRGPSGDSPHAVAYPAYDEVDEIHGVLAYVEGAEEHEVHEQEEDGEAPYLMGHHSVYALGEHSLVLLHSLVRLLQRALYVAIFGVCDGRLAVFVYLSEYILLAEVTLAEYLVAVVELTDDVLHLAVVLKELDGEETH